MAFKCEHCGAEVETEIELDIEHRACRLKAQFPGAYSEGLGGLVTFDMAKIGQALGLFKDEVINIKGEDEHPLEGGLHFHVGAFRAPEVWLELPVQVGNQLSTWTFFMSEQDWERMVARVEAGLERARKYIAAQREAAAEQAGDKQP